MIENLQAHYGFTKMPFGKALAPGMLHRHGAHAELDASRHTVIYLPLHRARPVRKAAPHRVHSARPLAPTPARRFPPAVRDR